ncbi:MAG: glycosyltransferase family 4 protein [Polyangiales bacterium]
MLLCVLDHATQYDPPLWRALAASTTLKAKVWYSLDDVPFDPELGLRASWDGVHGGYDHSHVPLKQLATSLLRLSPRPQAVMLPSWRRPQTLQVLPWARALKIPVILCTDKTLNEPSPSGARGHVYTALHGLRARAFDAFVTPGLLGRQYLASLGCAYESIATGLYPIDLAFWQAQRERLHSLSSQLRAEAPHPQPFVLVAVCKLSEREDPLRLLEAFASFARERPDAYFIQVGDGPLRSAFEAKVRELGVARQVKLAGFVDYKQLAAYYGAADVFAHVPAREPWGLSVLEAMACGLPVLAATTVGAAADLVEHGQTGALAYADDPSSIARALALIAKDARSMGERAAQAVRRFDVHVAARDLAQLVERLSQRSPAAGSYGRVLFSDFRNEFGRWSP